MKMKVMMKKNMEMELEMEGSSRRCSCLNMNLVNVRCIFDSFPIELFGKAAFSRSTELRAYSMFDARCSVLDARGSRLGARCVMLDACEVRTMGESWTNRFELTRHR